MFVAGASQVLLKRGTMFGKTEPRTIRSYFNFWVLAGLITMVFGMLMNIKGLRYVPLKSMAFVLPSVYIIIPLFSHLFLKERLGKRLLIGTLVMIVGIIIFNIPFGVVLYFDTIPSLFP